LQRRLDGEPLDRAALAEHLARCPECMALHAAAQRLREALRSLPPPLPPADLSGRIVARVLADHRARRHRRLSATAAAAALLVAGLTAYYWPRPVGPTLLPPEQVVQAPPPELTPPPSLRDNMTQATSAVASLTWRKADETVSQTRLLWPAVSPPPLEEVNVLGESLDSPTRSLHEAGRSVSAGLEPVTTSARRALDMFRREFPPMGTGDGPGS
jgi:anti-sigma factor RsiW